MIKLKTYKVLSNFLLYPNEELKNSIDYALDILKEDGLLPDYYIEKISLFIIYIKQKDLLYLQESYVSIFDRQSYFSLYLFEHIHGDSRDRGMAIIDLKNLYRKSNFDVSMDTELPDFLPVFLEYLSVNSKEQASYLLGEIVNIITVLYLRLKSINNIYYIIFLSLEFLSDKKSDKNIVNKLVNNDFFKNSSILEIDKNWEEPKTF